MPSKLSKQCEKCKYKDDCDEKRMAGCLYFNELPLMADAAMPLAQPLMADIFVKHDYRDIKIAENTTITIDLEDMKKQLERDFYKAIGCPSLNFGA